MEVVVDISLYPLADDFIPHIDTFIYKVQENPQIQVEVSDTSTTLRGEYDDVMNALTNVMKSSLASVPCSFNLRILGGKTGNIDNKHR